MGRRFLTKGRSSGTYKRKITKMKKLYKNLYRASKKSKSPPKDAFHLKYPTEASFLKIVKIKEPNKVKKTSSLGVL